MDKVDHISIASFTVGAKAAKRIGLGVDLQAGDFVLMERTAQHLISVGCEVVMGKYLADVELLFDLGDFHG